ncbi:hypothetical protein Bbelb_175660 [Branchiostoma belcheri]|nr:hypothetical protein Bbelb_175660 [Branchiostoma belcheri]
MESKTRNVGQGDGGKERSSVRQERPGIWSVLASWFAEPVDLEVDHTESHGGTYRCVKHTFQAGEYACMEGKNERVKIPPRKTHHCVLWDLSVFLFTFLEDL